MRTRIILTLAVLAAACVHGPLQAQVRSLLDLKGTWSIELGDDPRWALPSFDDSRWSRVPVPSAWENEGFPGYDGYAWYRTAFYADPSWKGKRLYLRVGTIDDADEVYVNGRFIGFTGQLPPKYITAYQVPRRYYIPDGLLRLGGQNVIAVRVYDGELRGGIVGGPLDICEESNALMTEIPLTGPWKFRTGDDPAWASPAFDDRPWQSVAVPAYWETQGHKEYDGFGWYRTRFRVPAWTEGKTMILLLGRIDDLDEAYLNGERVGRTGKASDFGAYGQYLEEYSQLRAYTVRPGLLKGGENVLAVRVFDGQWHGGIYDGPVGFVSRETFIAWEGRSKDWKSWIEGFFKR
jgi:sialate O-acetylesterase